MLQLDFSNPILSMSIAIVVVVLVIWIVAELRLEGGTKSAIRIFSAAVLSVTIMFLMYALGLIVF